MNKRYRFVCTINIWSIVAQTLIWFVLSVLTVGLALPFFGYYFVRIIINHTEMHEI
ncbi:MAG: DUF6693 family protein [Pirellulales bacterium]|nr:DUF6693 family protein [Pirellulales bacterium]